jgi:hypothetical protein
MAFAQSLIDTGWVGPAIFAAMTVALIFLAVYMGAWATREPSYLRTLAYLLAGLSLAFAVALGYETAAVASNRFPTISYIAHGAFEAKPIWWVIIFGAIALAVGLLATVFTRVAQTSSRLIRVQRRLDGPVPPLAWALSVAAGIVVGSFLVTGFSSPLASRSGSDPGFSWWVLYLGGVMFGVGALVAWGLDLRPGAPSARMASITVQDVGTSASGRPRGGAAAEKRISIALFSGAAFVLAAFALFMVAWGAIHGGYLAPLCYSLAVMSAALAGALVYQVVVSVNGSGNSIADVADAAFTTHALAWVAVFSVLLFGMGLLATHFTRKASLASAVVATERAAAGVASLVVWALALAIVMAATAVAVNRLTPRIAHDVEGYSRVSWWVIYTGGALYALGALVAWATNWAP